MSKYVKTKEEIELLRESGRRLCGALDDVEAVIRPGVSTKELDSIAEEAIRRGGDVPAFLKYRPWGAPYPYPASLCVSLNDEIVHGIPRGERIIQEGDIVSIDLGVTHKHLITDSARTIPVGKISVKTSALLQATKECLQIGIDAARAGTPVGDIGCDIQEYVSTLPERYAIVRDLGGHGVGRRVHEEPYIANFGTKRGQGMRLKPGMVIALEPMLTLGRHRVVLESDGYTYRTADRSLSAHFEHTILITDGEPEILTHV